MKRFSTTIETVDALKTSINNSRAAGIFKNGENREEFAANVSAYIDYCEAFGCRVVEAARPDRDTTDAWYSEAARADDLHQYLVRIYGPKVERGMRVVEYTWPDGSGSWSQCTTDDLYAVVAHYERMGCMVTIDGRDL